MAGKRYLVTGASSGIGRATAVRLVGEGASVIAVARRIENLTALAAELATPDRLSIVPADVADPDAVQALLQGAVPGDSDRLDGIVHCAAESLVAPLRVSGAKLASRLFETNVSSTLALLRGFASKRVSNDGSSFVALSSAAAHAASPGLAAYAASKAALESLVRTAGLELRDRRLRVNAVAPGYVDTPMMEKSRASNPRFDEVLARQFLGIIPPEAVADLIAYLLSDAARFVTGSVFMMDGGLTL